MIGCLGIWEVGEKIKVEGGGGGVVGGGGGGATLPIRHRVGKFESIYSAVSAKVR